MPFTHSMERRCGSAVAALCIAIGALGSSGSSASGQAPRAPTGVRVMPATQGPGSPIYPGQNAQAIVSAAPPGVTFVFKNGVHRMQTIRPRDGDTFTAEAGATLSGARPLTTFTRSGSYWVAEDQTQQGVPRGECAAGYPRCNRPEQLFIDDRLLRHVASLGEVGPGTWHFDYAADRIYFGEAPAAAGSRPASRLPPSRPPPTT